MELEWYKNVSYEDKKELAKENLISSVSTFVAAGYWIRSIWEDERCREEGYATIWEMAEAEFGLKKSEASRTISMNKKYSVGGYSPMILEKYTRYNKSQLQEMLTMTEEQLDKVNADMKIQELRQLKKTGATPEELKMLRKILAFYVREKYLVLSVCCIDGSQEELLEVFRKRLDLDVPVKHGDRVFFTGEDKDELVERITGEVLATYSPEVVKTMVLEEYRKLHELKRSKRKPVIKGLCDNAYCSECGAGLNEPDSGLEVDMICPECGQDVDWSSYPVENYDWMSEEPVNTISEVTERTEIEKEAVATSQEPVSTMSDILLEAEIIEEIEADEEKENDVAEVLEFEVLDEEENFEFANNMEEKITEPEIIIDGEFRELPMQEEVSAYGLVKTEYPEGSCLSAKGCGHIYSCFSCAQECGIRQENRYCVEAALGHPFGCTTMNVLELLKEEKGNSCQFVNHELAPHTAGSKEANPCCKSCREEVCGYRCNRAKIEALEKRLEAKSSFRKMEEVSENISVAEEKVYEAEEVPMAAVKESEIEQIKDILEKEKKLLDEYLEFGDFPEFTVKRQKIIVGALANMVCELEETAEKEAAEQPELPFMSNNNQRKEFIAGYESWPVWLEEALTGEKYYRYEFENGTAFVVKVYFHRCFDYHAKGKWEDRYYDGWGAEEYYIMQEGKHFKDCLTNKSCMMEFLKNLQKGEK